jgi:hypothetical protein
MILADNTVIPSYLGMRSRGRPGDNGSQNNLALRMGEVKELVYPDNPRNISKRFIEYRVEVQHSDGNGPGVGAIYEGCILANPLGGMADRSSFTLRADEAAQASPDGIGTGSKVLLLCVNGQTTQAVIISGVRDTTQDQTTVESKADGHNLFWEFNGIGFKVNKDGEATVSFRGATKTDGTLAGADNGPTTVQFLKNGNLEIRTKDSNQSIVIDNEHKKVAFNFDSEWTVNVNGSGSQTYGKDWKATAGTTITLAATGAIALTSSTGTMALSCAGGLSLTSAGLSIGKATDAMIKGSTFRAHQSAMHQHLMAQLQALSAALAAAGTALAASQFPSAGTQLGLAATAAASMTTAIGQFEGQAHEILSTVNKAD